MGSTISANLNTKQMKYLIIAIALLFSCQREIPNQFKQDEKDSVAKVYYTQIDGVKKTFEIPYSFWESSSVIYGLSEDNVATLEVGDTIKRLIPNVKTVDSVQFITPPKYDNFKENIKFHLH